MKDEEILRDFKELVKKSSLSEGLDYLKELKPYINEDNIGIVGESIENFVNNLLKDKKISRADLIRDLKAILSKKSIQNTRENIKI